jgi:hypothetical protein
MTLFAQALRQLGTFLGDRTPLQLVQGARGSAVRLAETVGRGMSMWNDVGFYKRAQILGSDLSLGGVGAFTDVDAVTIFADNLVPHVLRVEGVLHLAPELAEHIDARRLLVDTAQEREIRAAAVHACVALAAGSGCRSASSTCGCGTAGRRPSSRRSRATGRGPCSTEHEDVAADPVAVLQVGAQPALALEARGAGEPLRRDVLDVGDELDPPEAERAEHPVGEHAQPARPDAAAPRPRSDPVAGLQAAVVPVDVVHAGRAEQLVAAGVGDDAVGGLRLGDAERRQASAAGRVRAPDRPQRAHLALLGIAGQALLERADAPREVADRVGDRVGQVHPVGVRALGPDAVDAARDGRGCRRRSSSGGTSWITTEFAPIFAPWPDP